MNISTLEARLTTLPEEQQKIADAHSNQDFQFCGIPEIYFEGTIPVEWFESKETDDQRAHKIGTEFMKQFNERLKTK